MIVFVPQVSFVVIMAFPAPFAVIFPPEIVATAESEVEYFTVAVLGHFLTERFTVSPILRVVLSAFTVREGLFTVTLHVYFFVYDFPDFLKVTLAGNW